MKKNEVKISAKRYQELLAAEQRSEIVTTARPIYEDHVVTYNIPDWMKDSIGNVVPAFDMKKVKGRTPSLMEQIISENAQKLGKQMADDVDKVMKEAAGPVNPMIPVLRDAGWNCDWDSKRPWIHEKTVAKGIDPTTNRMSLEQAYGWEMSYQHSRTLSNEINFPDAHALGLLVSFLEIAQKLPVGSQIRLFKSSINMANLMPTGEEPATRNKWQERMDKMKEDRDTKEMAGTHSKHSVKVDLTSIDSLSEDKLPIERNKDVHIALMYRSDMCTTLTDEEHTRLTRFLGEGDKELYDFLSSIKPGKDRVFKVLPTGARGRYLSVYSATITNAGAKLLNLISDRASTWFDKSPGEIDE